VYPGYLSATVGCQHPGCANLAAVVRLIAKGTPHPDDAVLFRSLTESKNFGGVGQIILRYPHDLGVPGVPNVSMPVTADRYPAIDQALRSAVLAALHSLSEDYAPFLCTTCPGAFCAPHLRLVEVWDEAGPDFWTGTCPGGHRQFIDH
jgi:hypothetical protein